MSIRFGFRSPTSPEELSDLVAGAASAKTPFEVRGRGSKHEVGRAVQAGGVVSTEGLVRYLAL